MSSWLIDRGERRHLREYWVGRGWSSYPLEAIRFARAEDAEKVIKHLINVTAPKARAVEYLNGEVRT